MRETGIILLPLLGTAMGAGAVFFTRWQGSGGMGRGLNGFAAGVMTAASVWSLILPAVEQSAHWGWLSFLPAAVGIWLGFVFVGFLETCVPDGASLTAAAVALHNLPEGMAVGVGLAGYLNGSVSLAAVFALSLGIAVQNLPEGAIISLPLAAGRMRRGKAFGWGVLSGVIEPVGAAAAVLVASAAVPALPWLLGFSAGAMLYVAAAELSPQMGNRMGAGCYAMGFTLMMALDVALG